jgi:hypothetical protein
MDAMAVSAWDCRAGCVGVVQTEVRPSLGFILIVDSVFISNSTLLTISESTTNSTISFLISE